MYGTILQASFYGEQNYESFQFISQQKTKVTERGWKIEYSIELTLYIILLKLVECEVLYMYIVFIKII